MQVNTTRFGAVEVSREELITFPWGIPGFESLKIYTLLDRQAGPFQWLQSVEDPSVAFVVCPPDFIGIEYNVPQSKAGLVRSRDPENVLVLNIVSLNREKGALRFHVRSPLLFNPSERIGCQWPMEPEELKSCLTVPAGAAAANGQEQNR